ncbi:carbamoyltransferase C-terminal domain-containing protein [Kitasatospora sp. LaBMicrA B282]|uniref:carbamoyltransferase C-terminal domain-containing protein n=1 Tax=Kitasatospora sp. LaBMicrA B282 TaxID=3420949 RepID=UPI003D0FAB1E
MVTSSATQYFLSCYLSQPGAMSVVNFRHDQNIALWRRSGRSVELVRVWELERLTGQKHHHWPLFTAERIEALLTDLLSGEGLRLSDISASWGTRGIPKAAELEAPAGGELFPMHSLAHLFSGLMMDRGIFENETIIALAVDGGPDFGLDGNDKEYWYSGCVSVRGSLHFAPVESPGPLYSACRTLFHHEPGSLMALASACTTEAEYDIEAALGRLKLFGGGIPLSVGLRFVQKIINVVEPQLASRVLDDRFSASEHLQSAVMSIVQRCSEIVMVRNIENLCARFGVAPADAYLSISGGFGLNCPTNTYLLDRFGFRGLLTPPCASDSGQALGLGLLGLHNAGLLDGSGFRLHSAYYGSTVSDVEESLDDYEDWIAEVCDYSPEQLVADIVEMPVAWVAGAAEIGPRALGHRSLLGDPRSVVTKDLLNQVKGRQWWRPVAPLVMDDHAAHWFVQGRPSPFMLEAVQVRPERRSEVPAILHLDGSARHQTLARAVNPQLYDALAAFDKETSVPIFCNTSLNDRNEPIVDNARQALNFCIRKGIRVAYLDGRRVALRASARRLPPVGPAARSSDFFAADAAAREQAWQEWREGAFSAAEAPHRARPPWLAADARFALDGTARHRDPSLAWMSRLARRQV